MRENAQEVERSKVIVKVASVPKHQTKDYVNSHFRKMARSRRRLYSTDEQVGSITVRRNAPHNQQEAE